MSERSSFDGLRDFSVDAQRRVFVEQQELERQAAEHRRTTRKAKQALGGSGATPTGVALSGVMSAIDEGRSGRRVVGVGDDDDDSIVEDDGSLDSEESFYVGISRADYTQPDSLYGEEKEEGHDASREEDRFGIARLSVAMTRREDDGVVDWDADIPIHDESTGSSLYEFMNGPAGHVHGAKDSRAKRDHFVAMPIVGAGLEWKEEGRLGREDAAAVEQVYEHSAAEGKMFIDKIVNAPAENPGVDDVAAVAAPNEPPSTPGAVLGHDPGGGGGGHYPALAPLALFSPVLATPGGARVAEGEDNGLRQMREREIRKEAQCAAAKKMEEFKEAVSARKDATGKVDASDMMRMLEQLMKE